jgi:hypothetical protein
VVAKPGGSFTLAPMTIGAVNRRIRNKASGSIGSVVRACKRTKATAVNSDSDRPPSTHGLVKPWLPDSITAAAKAASVVTARAALPRWTRRCAAPGVRGA